MPQRDSSPTIALVIRPLEKRGPEDHGGDIEAWLNDEIGRQDGGRQIERWAKSQILFVEGSRNIAKMSSLIGIACEMGHRPRNNRGQLLEILRRIEGMVRSHESSALKKSA